MDIKNAKTELERVIYGQNKVYGFNCGKLKVSGV
jgi:hypothetical protein